ncbi:MAG: FTR1 family protein [Mariprofundaceae bacterium]
MIIIFREMLEMALVIGIVMAATKGIVNTRRWIAAGAAAGFLGAAIVAILADFIAGSFSGVGERVFHAAVLALAAIMIAWTVIWMTQHGKELTSRMREVGSGVSSGDLPKTALAVVVFAAVMREGSEAVLFLHGAAMAGHGDAFSMAVGGFIGVLLGGITGWMVYQGLLRIPLRHLFGVVGWILVVLAAGMASQSSGQLVRADLLPALIQPIWDSTAWLPRSELPGQFLHVMTGYDDKPSGMQLLVFLTSLLLMAGMIRYIQSEERSR